MLYVLLFVYAGFSKILDFQNFQVQLGQSPLLSAFAGWISVFIPIFEFVICILIIIPRSRLIGLFLAYGLMTLFTVYIFIILHYSSFVPCSCGGVLEKLNWKQHLIFNIFFVFLAVIAIFIHLFSLTGDGVKLKIKVIFTLLFSILVCSVLIVGGLFLLSENIVHYHNKLSRRFPQNSIHTVVTKDLKFNSFYIAGVDDKHIYLGNSTSPLIITVLNNTLIQIEKKMIDLDRKDLPFKGVKISILAPYFFVVDGTVPCIYRGLIANWKAEFMWKGEEYFGTAVAIDSVSIAGCTYSSITGESILGVIPLDNSKRTLLNPKVLVKQLDGVFDTDGHLHYSKGLDRILFLYAYRNQFTVTDSKLKIEFRGNTIDTISRAKLSIVSVKNHKQKKFSKPPLFVNKDSAVYNNLLFVNSAIPGKYEENKMWQSASIIDLYNLTTKSYLFSFLIYDIDGKKMKDFKVQGDKLYALIGNHITLYKLDKRITSNYNK